jgi:hypothetical protein
VATCPNCGNEAQDGAWTCGFCGSPIGRAASAPPAPYDEPVRDAAYYNAPTIYGTTAPTVQPLRPYKSWRGAKLLGLGLVLAIVVVALAGAWFFFLRPSPGDEFVGAWHGTFPVGATRQLMTFNIDRKASDFRLTLTGEKGNSLGPYAMSLAGDRLVTTLVYVGGDPQQQATAAALRSYASTMVNDYKLVFFLEHGTLYMRPEGTPRPGVKTDLHVAVGLTKAK